jgi:hypothetical protein
MDRRTVVFGLLATTYASAAHADVWSLVSNDEFLREGTSAQAAPPAAAQAPGAPVITVDMPDESKPVQSPVSIRISFHPQGNATINPSSFRATYGFLGIDITSRITDHAQLTASGLSADNAQLPTGHHKVNIQIADSMNRIGARTIDFTVA